MENTNITEREKVIKEIVDKANTYSTDIEKLKYVYNWFVDNVKYDYEYLRLAEIEAHFAKKYFGNVNKQSSATILVASLWSSNFAFRKTNGVEIAEEDIDLAKEWGVIFERKYYKRKKSEYFDSFEKKNGVCATFASGFKEICDLLNIPCLYVQGVTLLKGYQHAWNVVEVDNKPLHIDITYAIFDKDKGEYNPDKYFLITEEDLVSKSNRTINENSRQLILKLTEDKDNEEENTL